MEQTNNVTAALVPNAARPVFLHRYFGDAFLVVEQAIYTMTDELCPDYMGGVWAFFELSNGGAYMAPDRERTWRMQVRGNGYEGELSSDAVGVVVTLFAMSHLSFAYPGFSEMFTDRYHQLRDYAGNHPEASQIFAAID